MARAVRAAANRAYKETKSPYFGKTARKASTGKSRDDDDEPESSTSSGDDEGDSYEEQDSDHIDDDSDDENVEEDLEEEEADLHISEEDSNGGRVLDFSVKKKTSRTTVTPRKRKGQTLEGGSASSKRSRRKSDSADIDSSEEEEEDLKDGRKVTKTKLVKAPTSSVPAGVIDPHTMEFLADLIDNNDRDWFAKNDARYRHALQNWQTFVDAVQPEIQRGDWSVPELPAKELIHRIYRDVRFSNDKTPYKKNLAASFSRTGRKGPFAGYYLQISPGGRSLLAGGKWGPERNDLATIRSNIIRSSKPLRRVISNPKFVEYFGPPKPDAKGKGKRCNIFGAEDMLKVAPKMNGVDKTHKDIDLLKLRTIGVVYNFDDEEVLSPDFKKKVGDVVEVMAPLVLLINEMTHPQSEDEGEEDPSEDEQAEVTAASGKEPSDPGKDNAPEEEGDEDGMEGGGGIEAV